MRHFLSRALAAPLFGGVEPFVQFWLRQKEQLCDIFFNLDL